IPWGTSLHGSPGYGGRGVVQAFCSGSAASRAVIPFRVCGRGTTALTLTAFVARRGKSFLSAGCLQQKAQELSCRANARFPEQGPAKVDPFGKGFLGNDNSRCARDRMLGLAPARSLGVSVVHGVIRSRPRAVGRLADSLRRTRARGRGA